MSDGNLEAVQLTVKFHLLGTPVQSNTNEGGREISIDTLCVVPATSNVRLLF